MSFNRELQDFLSAFGTMDRIATNASRRKYYDSRANGGNSPTNPNSPAGIWVNKQAGGAPASSGGFFDRAGNWLNRQFGGSSGGAVPTGGYGGGAPSDGGSFAPSYEQADPLYSPMETYAGGGVVSEAPDPRMRAYPDTPGSVADTGAAHEPFTLAGGDDSPAPPFTNTPRPEPAVPVPPRAAAPVTSRGNAPRKALNDQTRTEAYDPDLDGPGAVPVNGSAASRPAAVAASAVPTGQSTPQSGDMSGNAGAGLSTNNARSDLENALHGGMTFAQHTFHLNDPNDPHHQGGAQALFSGVGAASPEIVKAVDQKVNNGVPYDPQLYQVRRLEAIYRWYSMNGESDKANKAAFELLQYSAGVAAQWGARGVEQFKQGDLPGAIKSVQEGYNHVPDGNHMTVQGDTATIVDKRTGQPVQQFQFTPEQVFNAALGLSNRSLYWQVLAQRVSQTAKGGTRQQTPDQQELTRARIENVRARTDRLKRTPIKGTGAAGPSDAMKSLIDRINGEKGGTPASPKGETPAPVQAAVPEPADVEMMQDGEPGDDETGTNAGGKPTQAETVAPNSVLRLKPPQPGSAATPVTPEGTSQDIGQDTGEQASAAASIPATPATEKVRARLQPPADHPGYDEGVTYGPDHVPDVVVSRSGENYVPATKRGQPEPFGEAPPGPNPYAKYAADVAKLPPKERTAVQALLNQKMRAYDKQVADYKARSKAHDAAESKRLDAEFKAGQQQQKEELKAALGYNMRPSDTEAIEAGVNSAYDTVAQKNPDAVKQWGDPGRIKQIAFELAKMNKLPADQALRLAGELTNIDPDQPYARTYTPRGKDVLGNIVVTTQNDGPLHIPPHVYKNIIGIIQKSGQLDQAGRNAKAAAAAAPKPMDKLREAGSAFLRAQPKTDIRGRALPPTATQQLGDVFERRRQTEAGLR